MAGILDAFTNFPSRILQSVAGAANSLAPGAATREAHRPRRRQKPGLTDVDIATLQALQAGLGAGLDPNIALGFMEDIEGGLAERTAAWRERNQARREALMTQLPTIAGTAAEMASAGLPQSFVESAFSGYGGQLGNRADQLIDQLYSGGGGAATLDPESIAGLAESTTNYATGKVTGAPLPLSNVRQILIGQMRAQGATEPEIMQAYDLIGNTYSNLGYPTGDTPLTWEERVSAANTPSREISAGVNVTPGFSLEVSPDTGEMFERARRGLLQGLSFGMFGR